MGNGGNGAGTEEYSWCHEKAKWQSSSGYYNKGEISRDLMLCESGKRTSMMVALAVTGGGGRIRTANVAKRRLVIGRSQDLSAEGALRSNEYRLQWPSSGSVKSEWKINSGLLRSEMHRKVPIRDASPGDKGGMYLNAERNLLQDRGWGKYKNLDEIYWRPSGE
ncbi:MAG: hypothetical protein KKE11_02685 [Gammaproteobacteria bacterium]|nr:hypothetical protein [Gammaproteobacteria bacterium]